MGPLAGIQEWVCSRSSVTDHGCFSCMGYLTALLHHMQRCRSLSLFYFIRTVVYASSYVFSAPTLH